MARMYPEHPQYCDFKSEQERALYHELRHQLPETVSVLHGLSVHVHPDPRHELDIEIDFLVVDPERGLLVLEVKGGGVHRDGRTGQWYTVDDAGQRHPIDDPFAQARKNRCALQSFLETAAKTRPFTFPIRCAVAFPDVTVGRAYLDPGRPTRACSTARRCGTCRQRSRGRSGERRRGRGSGPTPWTRCWRP